MIDLAIAYRIYPKVSKVPPIFADDKFRLSELCLNSFKQGLGSLRIKMWVLLDDCPKEYNELFKKYFNEDELELINLPGVGNAGTFGMQMKILEEQNLSDYIYFAEDDYFYLPEALPEMIEFMKNNPGADFVTPYDHLDYYEHKLHDYETSSVQFGKRKWRTGATTCMTFLTSKKKLAITRKIFKSYTRKNFDTSLWLTLTRTKVLNPYYLFKYLFSDFYLFKVLVRTWIHTPFENLFSKKMELYVPVPTLSTHMDSLHLAPGIDWQQQFEKFLEK